MYHVTSPEREEVERPTRDSRTCFGSAQQKTHEYMVALVVLEQALYYTRSLTKLKRAVELLYVLC